MQGTKRRVCGWSSLPWLTFWRRGPSYGVRCGSRNTCVTSEILTTAARPDTSPSDCKPHPLAATFVSRSDRLSLPTTHDVQQSTHLSPQNLRPPIGLALFPSKPEIAVMSTTPSSRSGTPQSGNASIILRRQLMGELMVEKALGVVKVAV